MWPQNPACYSPAVSYGVPALPDTSLEDVVNLRLNEELFAQLRSKLVEMMNEVARSTTVTAGYRAMIDEVRTIAEDIVRPAYEEFERKRRHGAVTNWIVEKAAGGVVLLGLNGVAHALGSPVGPGGAAGGAVGKMVTRSRRRQQKDLDVCCSVLVSLLN
jgi:hypothetical protein